MDEIFLSFDCYAYPGDAEMAWMWAHGFRISGLYLNHARGGRDAGWIGNGARLRRAGWGLIPLYLGWQTIDTQSRRLPPPADPLATARADAAEALDLLQIAGLPPGAALYFDIEDGTVPSGAYDHYLRAWLGEIGNAGYRPAIYCSHLCAAWARQAGAAVWSFHIPEIGGPALDPGNFPTDPIDAGCIGTQIRQRVSVQGLPLEIDFSRFSIPDPSCPVAVSQAIA